MNKGDRQYLHDDGARSNGGSIGVIERFGDSLAGFQDVHLRPLDDDREDSVPVESLCGLDAHYEVYGEIGRGGIGQVYQAHDIELGRDVALKVLHRDHINKPESVSRFVEEAQIGGQLNHPSILPVHELGLWGERIPFFAMKLVSGETLQALLAERSHSGDDRRRFLGIFEQVCQAVSYAHSRGVVHRDLKPANVMVGRFGEVQVMDWGMAKVLDRKPPADSSCEAPVATARSRSDTATSVADSVMGTLADLAPEQTRGEAHEMDERTDVFALGAMLCEILTLQPPYLGVDLKAMPRPARNGDLDDALARLAGCGADRELVEIAEHCLQTKRSARPENATVIAAALADYLARVEERAREARITAAVAGEKASTAKRIHRLTLMVAGSLLLTLLFAGGFLWIRSEQDGRRADLESQIATLLAETRHLQGRAQVAPRGDVEAWTKAKESLEPVAVLAASIEVDPALRATLTRVDRELQAGHTRAEAVKQELARDSEMLRKLEAVASHVHDTAGSFERHAFAHSRSRGYESAFADYGLDLWKGSLASVAGEVRDTGIKLQLSIALDDWAAAERELRGRRDRARRLQRIACEVDRDPWRQKVRAIVLADAFDRAALVRMAQDVRPEDLSEASALLLARKLYHEEKAPPVVIRLLERAWQRNTSSYALAVELGEAHIHAQETDWNAVRRAFTTALSLRPDNVAVLGHLSQALKFSGKLDAAMAACEKARELAPNAPNVHFYLGEVLFKRNQPDEAIASYRNAIRLGKNLEMSSGWLAMFHNNLGLVYSRQGKMDQAVAEYEASIELDGRSVFPHSNLASVYSDQGRFKDAIAEYELAIGLDKGDAGLHSALGNVLRKSGNLEKALAACTKAIGLDPDLASAHYNLGLVWLAKSELDQAIDEFQKAIALDDTGADFYSSLGSAFESKGMFKKAVEAHEKAVAADPHWAGSHNELGITLQRMGKFDQAIAEFKEAIRVQSHPIPFGVETDVGSAIFLDTGYQQPDLADLHGNLGVAYTDKGDFDAAATTLEKAIEAWPEVAHLYNALANTRCRQGQRGLATKLFKTAAEKQPDWFMPHHNLGVLFHEDGKFDQAIAHYKQALERDPAAAWTWWNLGGLYVHLRRFPEALAHYRAGKAVGFDVPERLLAEAQARAERETELLAILDGQPPLDDSRDLVWAGKLGADQGRHAASARVMRQAFEKHPELVDVNTWQVGPGRSKKYYRYNASCSAALAGAGNAKDAHELPEAQREELRRQAVKWLHQDLDGWCRFAERGGGACTPALRHLQWALEDKDLAGIRDADALSKLSTAEREVCVALWQAYRRAIKELKKGAQG